MHPITILLLNIIDIYKFILTIWIVLTLLIQFNIVNIYQPIVRKISYILDRLTEPALTPIRKIIPSIGGIDFSPIILFLIIGFLSNMLAYYF